MRFARQILAFVAVAATTFTVIAPVRGQVDYRSDHFAPGMSGNLLDANPLIGSGGYNRPISSPWTPGLGADAVITRNVTGLGGFHGQTPLLQTNQFRDTLPSAGLSEFQRISVGIDDVQSGRTLRPTHYLGPQETISDLGFIRDGLNRPGSSTVLSPYVQPRPLTGPVVREPIQPRARPLLSSGLRLPAGELGTTQTDLAPDTPASSLLRSPWQRSPSFTRAAMSSLFGTPRSSRAIVDPSNDLADSRFAPVPIDRTVDLVRKLDREPPGIGPDDGRDTRILTRDSRLRDASSPSFAGPGRADSRPSIRGFAERRPLESARPSDDESDAPFGAGIDRFTLMYDAVWASQRAGRAPSGFARREAAPAEAPDGRILQGPSTTPEPAATPEPGESDPAKTSPDSQALIADAVARLRWADKTLGDPITTFAHENRGRLDQYLREAERALHDGEYYRAAELYELAQSVDPRNPLPWLGRGHALAAAGDYMSAAYMLERGIGLFPQIAAFRLDLPSIVGRHDAFDLRRAELERRLETAENHRLRFLLGYLELYSGLVPEGLRELELAAQGAPEGSIIATFPDLVVGRSIIPALEGRE